jgi:hypothetical protein
MWYFIPDIVITCLQDKEVCYNLAVTFSLEFLSFYIYSFLLHFTVTIEIKIIIHN